MLMMLGRIVDAVDAAPSREAAEAVIDAAVQDLPEKLEKVAPEVGDEYVECLHAAFNEMTCKATARIREVLVSGLRVKGERNAVVRAQVYVDDPSNGSFYI